MAHPLPARREPGRRPARSAPSPPRTCSCSTASSACATAARRTPITRIRARTPRGCAMRSTPCSRAASPPPPRRPRAGARSSGAKPSAGASARAVAVRPAAPVRAWQPYASRPRGPVDCGVMAHAIEVSGLTKRFGATLAVDDLSFTVAEGRIVGFLGPNGAGKTTTLRVLLGLERATRRHDEHPGRRLHALPDPGGHGRRGARRRDAASGPQRPQPPAGARPGRRLRRRAASRSCSSSSAAGRREPARGRLLARHAPAARPRGRAARRPARARARRAGQRPRPAGHPLAARLPAPAGRRGPRDPRLQPRARRGRADRRRRRGHPQGPLDRSGAAGRADGAQRRRVRVAGPDVGGWASCCAPTARASPTTTARSSCATAPARTSAG